MKNIMKTKKKKKLKNADLTFTANLPIFKLSPVGCLALFFFVVFFPYQIF